MREKRKYRRIKVSNLARLNNSDCPISNISKEGLMMSSGKLRALPTGKQVDIQLKIKGEWVDLKAQVMWSLKDNASGSVSMGFFIISAPHEYTGFISNLYFEVKEN